MQQCENSHKPRPQQPVAKRQPARRRERGGEGGGAMNSTTVARSELSLCECESAGEQVSERKCVRCRKCVCVFARARVCQKERERESLCWCGKSQCSVFKEKDRACLAPLPLRGLYHYRGLTLWTIPSFPPPPLHPSHLPLKGTPVRVKAKTTDLALVNRSAG